MARFYFDLTNGDGPVRDDQGQEIASRQDVAREVGRILSDIARDELRGSDAGAISIAVRDEAGQAVFRGHLYFETQWLDPIGRL